MVNFRQHARTDLAFDSGVTAIIGENGSGKTTILEAIAWALYGQPAIRGQRDGIRFMGAGGRAAVEVELEFELGGHRYVVTRGLTTAALYLDGSDVAVANSISGVNELLTRRLGMSRAEFFNTYFTGQKDLAVMAAMGTTERAQFLSRVLGYERLRAAQELAREKRREIGAEIVGLRSAMKDPAVVARGVAEADERLRGAIAASNEAGTRHSLALAELRRLTPAWETAQREREQWQRLLAEITIVEREVSVLQGSASRIASEILTLATVDEELAGLRAAVNPLADLRAEVSRLDEAFRLQGRRAALAENERALSDELVQLHERLDRLESAPDAEQEIAAALVTERLQLDQLTQDLEARRTSWVRDRQEAETKLQELRRQYTECKQQRERVTELGVDGICPTCMRVLGPSFHAVVGQLSELLETLQVDGQYYRDRGDQLAKPPAEIGTLEEARRTLTASLTQNERRLAKAQAAVQELPQVRRDIAVKEQRRAEMRAEVAGISDSYDAGRHRAARLEVERLTPMSLRIARLEAASERAPLAVQEQHRIAVELTDATLRRDQLRAQGATQEFSETAHDGVRSDFVRANDAARAAELSVVAAQGDVRSAQQLLDQAELARREHELNAGKLQRLNQGRLIHEELDRAFQELRADLNDALRPELSEVASSFLASLTDGRYTQLELDDRYEINLLEDGVAKPVISGGEEDIANLVLRLSISQMIADRSGQPFSLLILDEVFGSLDAARRESVLELLHRLEDRFEQVILITHIESVREGVDRVITVRYDQETGSSHVDDLGGGITPGAPDFATDDEHEVLGLA